MLALVPCIPVPEQVVEGVAVCHERLVAHRDLKPGNPAYSGMFQAPSLSVVCLILCTGLRTCFLTKAVLERAGRIADWRMPKRGREGVKIIDFGFAAQAPDLRPFKIVQ